MTPIHHRTALIREQGQVMVVGAVFLVLVVILLGLALDGVQGAQDHVTVQAAADAAAVAAADEYVVENVAWKPPMSPTGVLLVAQGAAAADGIATSTSNLCAGTAPADSPQQLHYVFSAAAGCPASSTDTLQILDPPASPPADCPPSPGPPWTCFEVIATKVEKNIFAGFFGFPTTTVQAEAIAGIDATGHVVLFG